MTAIHVAQILLWLVSIALIARSMRRMFYTDGGFDGRVGDAILASLDAGERERALTIARGEGWIATLARAGFDAEQSGLDVGIALDEARRDIAFDVQEGMRALRVMASLASATGLLGACWEFFWLTGGDHGLAGLMAGLPMELAMNRALLAVGLGFGAMFLTMSARTQLGREGESQLARLRKLAEGLETRLAIKPE